MVLPLPAYVTYDGYTLIYTHVETEPNLKEYTIKNLLISFPIPEHTRLLSSLFYTSGCHARFHMAMLVNVHLCVSSWLNQNTKGSFYMQEWCKECNMNCELLTEIH
jgi:hypothetical protein